MTTITLKKPLRFILLGFTVSVICACASKQMTLYEEIGGQKTIEAVTQHFIHEIEFNETVFAYFKESDVDRFREKFIEHMCLAANGPCQYTGDTMLDVHKGMKITESDFNLTVDLLINAMTRAGNRPASNRTARSH